MSVAKKAWQLLFGNLRNAAITLTLLGAALVFLPTIVRLELRERGYDKTCIQTETIPLEEDRYPLNYTVIAPGYIHPTDTAHVILTFERFSGSNPEKNGDRKLVNRVWRDRELDVTHVDAELEAPSFTALRVTAREAKDRPRRFVTWEFLLKPKPDVDGVQSFAYRVHFLNSQSEEVATISNVGSIEVGQPPFTAERVAAAIGIVSGAVGIYLQLSRQKDKASD